ncbi:MAG: type II toxin-antitoxin system VapC family toxin [Acidobacteriaceae bacterium]
MRLLIDTHILLWLNHGQENLSASQMAAISDSRNEVFVSAVSIWEIAVKRAKGLVRFEGRIQSVVDDLGFLHLPVSAIHAEEIAGLPMHHRDPFDRMLIAQSRMEQMTLVTSDATIRKYPVVCL